MAELAEKGVTPSVVNDQLGRLTFAKDLAEAIHYILQNQPEYGTYNMTNDGDVVSWADIAKLTFEQTGHNPEAVTGVTTQEYYVGKENIAPRPSHSELDLTKIKSISYKPRDWRIAFNEFIQELEEQK